MLCRSALVIPLLLAPLTMLPAQSAVWKIQRDEGTAYLGARCHMLRPADFPLPGEFDAAYAAAAVLVFETDLTRLQSPQAQQEIVTLGRQGPTGSLRRDLTPEVWAEVEKFSARASAPIGVLNGYRPWFLAFMIAELELQKLGVTHDGVDVHFHTRAFADGKAQLSLESFEQRLRLITRLGEGQQSELVLFSLMEAGTYAKNREAIVASWQAGELALMDELLNGSLRRNLRPVYDALIVQRNGAWRPQIVAMLQTSPVEFIIVDGAHLAGADGLIAGLQADGCSIEQLRATPDANR